MYFQFLIEDKSTEIVVEHVMKKMKTYYTEKNIAWDIKSFGGIGHLSKKGKPLEQKTGKLLNDLPKYMRAFDKILRAMGDAALVIVLDNDKRDCEQFRKELENVAACNMVLCDYVFCIAVKEMEAWLLGDLKAITEAYPNAKTQYIKKYKQDAICDTWEVLADIVYPQGLKKLRKEAAGSYHRIGSAKCEWADKVGEHLHLHENASPSYNYFVEELEKRILT
ncbi:MAG: DUF4276 family protein [Eubacteriales bacterium]|nr:DUF4276 family protein [Eubacteriales bacterium]